MSRYIALLALSSAALALPTPSTSFPEIGTSLTRAFEHKAAKSLFKRQSATDAGLDGLENLLNAGLYDTACENQCYPFIQELTDCVNNGVTNIAIGQCACEPTPIKAMKICGICVGQSGIEDAENFDALCTSAGAGSGSGSSDSSASVTGSSFASASSAVSSAFASQTSFASGTSFASRTSSAASPFSSSSSDSDDSSTTDNEDDISAGTGDETATVTAPGAAATTPGSGAGKVAGSAALAMAGLVAAILM